MLSALIRFTIGPLVSFVFRLKLRNLQYRTGQIDENTYCGIFLSKALQIAIVELRMESAVE